MGKIGRYHAWVARNDHGFEAVEYTRSANPAVGDPADYGYSDNGVFYGWGDFDHTVEDVESKTVVGFNRESVNITMRIGKYDYDTGVFTLYTSVTFDRYEVGVVELTEPIYSASESAPEPGFNLASFYGGDLSENPGAGIYTNVFMQYLEHEMRLFDGQDYSGVPLYDIQNGCFLSAANGRTITATFSWEPM